MNAFDKLQADLQRDINDIKANLPGDFRTVALLLKADIDLRVTTKGQLSDGSSLSYKGSNRYTPRYEAYKVGRGYPSFIQTNNTGAMWRNIGIVEEPVLNGEKMQLKIAARDQDPRGEQGKLDGNAERYGEILEPSILEVELAEDILTKRIQSRITSVKI